MGHSSGDLIVDLLAIVQLLIESMPHVELFRALIGADRWVRWFRRGPFECYSDRRERAVVGRYEAAGGDLLTQYTFPHECGLR